MMSIYKRALGPSFSLLHPTLQQKYGLTSASGQIAYGKGTMEMIRGGEWYRVLFHLGTRDHLLFPERGDSIPFTLENVAYKDKWGREAVHWIRRFHFPKCTRSFDAVMTFSEKEGKIMDAFGRSQRLVAVLDLSVTCTGGLLMRAERAYIQRANGARTALARLFTPRAEVREHYNEQHDALHIHVHIFHPLLGTMLTYEGLVHTVFAPIQTNDLSAYPAARVADERRGDHLDKK